MGKIMSLSGTEWQEMYVLTHVLNNLICKEELTEEEKCVIIWLTKRIKELETQKEKYT